MEKLNTKIEEVKTQYALAVYNLEQLKDISNDDLQFVIKKTLLLDALLMDLRGTIISYSTYKKEKWTLEKKSLIRNLRNWKKIWQKTRKKNYMN